MPETTAPLKDASTVVLLRDGEDGLEVFLQHRVKQMAFAGGMTVFPGGGVDVRDSDVDVSWVGPEPGWWAERLSTDENLARALVAAAVRETFEECGVLLAGTADAVVPDPSEYADDRRRLESHELSFAEFLDANGLALRADLLAPMANWITPKPEPRRYDTRFFLAAVPDGQTADGATSEAEATEWRRPADALADWDSGRRFLLPPTWTQLRDLAGHSSVDEALAAPRTVTQIEPDLAAGSGILGIGFDHADEYLAALRDGRLEAHRD
ncbi:MAG: NUDIX domain-containing protein [Gordonia sp. (in: high G+C Gram-positive bacteria)]|uniref:NUDIX hydrolase n=1 Tax=Gordonia sp. (in: high G+C Gram-positive bacteria) TaxID=84139 RepID=UPI0039E43D97